MAKNNIEKAGKIAEDLQTGLQGIIKSDPFAIEIADNLFNTLKQSLFGQLDELNGICFIFELTDQLSRRIAKYYLKVQDEKIAFSDEQQLLMTNILPSEVKPSEELSLDQLSIGLANNAYHIATLSVIAKKLG